MVDPTKLSLQATSDWHAHMCTHTHKHTHSYIQKIHDNCGVRGRDEKREDGVLWFSAHGSRKILAWEDMRIQNVHDYPGTRKREKCACACVCVRVREQKLSADSKPCHKRKVSLFALGDTFRNKATWFKCRLCASVLLDAVFTMVRWRLVLGMCLLWLSLSWARRELMCCVAYSSQTGSAAVTELVWKRISPWLTRRGINLN